MTIQPDDPDQADAPAPFWTETPGAFLGRTVIDPMIAAAENLSRQEADNPGAITRAVSNAMGKVEAVEDRLEEKLQPLDQAMDRAVDAAMSPVLQRLEKSSLVERILDWWLNLGKPKTDEARVEAWVTEDQADVQKVLQAVRRGDRTPAWATAFMMVYSDTPRGQDVDVERIGRVESLILQRIGQGDGG